MVIEEHHGVTSLFQQLGYVGVRHAHNAVNTGLTNDVAHMIKTYSFAIIWSEFPIAGVHVRLQRYHARMAQLCTWARLCYDVGVPFVLFGSFGRKWQDPQLKVMFDDQKLHKSYHRMCHFKLKVDSSQTDPSSTCFVAASTASLPSHSCECGLP